MKQNLFFMTIFILLMLLLTACSSSKDLAATNTRETEIQSEEAYEEPLEEIDVEKQIEQLKANAPSGYEVSKIASYHLTGNDIPEIIEILSENVPEFEERTIKINTFQYSTSTNKWETIFTHEFDELYSDLEIIDEGKMMGDKREQVAIGHWEGSGGFLSFVLMGSKDKKSVSILFDRFNGRYANGNIDIEGDQLQISEDGQVVDSFQWKGN